MDIELQQLGLSIEEMPWYQWDVLLMNGNL